MAKSIKKPQNKKKNYTKSSELFKVMSNPKRLEIMDIIKDKEITVNEISKILGTRKSNTSQHLAYLRYVGIAITRREGKNIFYRLADPKLMEACKILSEAKIKNIFE